MALKMQGDAVSPYYAGEGNPQNVPSITRFFDSSAPLLLPRALRPHEDLLRRAVATTLPTRLQRWENERGETGTNTQDPNSLLYYAANTYLLLFEKNKEGTNSRRDREVAAQCLETIARWQCELQPIIDLQRQLEEALTVYSKNAPIRKVE